MTSKRKILLVSPVGSHPTISGNSIRPVYLAKQLRELGYETHFAYTDFVGGDLELMRSFWGVDRFHYFTYRRGNLRMELTRLVRRCGGSGSRLSWILRSLQNRLVRKDSPPSSVDSYFDERMTPWLSSLHARYKFSAVVAHFVILSRALDAFPPSVVRILDSQEIFAVGRHGLSPSWIHITADEEIRALDRGDFVWVSQEHEQGAIEPFLGRKVRVVSHFVDPLPAVTRASLGSSNVLFIGANHPANVEGLRWFWSTAFPHLANFISAQQVVVVGKVKHAFGSEVPFRFLGPIADLCPVYRDSRLAICPIRSGTGIKSKNIEAFAFAKPVVTTSFGRLGMEDADGYAQFVADSPSDFADAVRHLLSDDQLCEKMMNSALLYANQWNGRLRDRMQQCLESAYREEFQ